jgi:hypothetical protein|tara:strand:+ start:263 stop:385 length:123 start_codon:yes stop_codon:yes gene_type:complete
MSFENNDDIESNSDIDLTNDGGAIIEVDNGKFGFLKIKPF